MKLGFGAGGLEGDHEETSQGAAATLQLGWLLTPKLALLLGGEFTAFARDAAHPALALQQSALTLGVQWMPFAKPLLTAGAHFDPTNLYLRAGVGAGHLIRQPYSSFNPFDSEQGAWGPAATVGVGWSPLRGRDWSLGIEATDSFVVYGGDLHQNFGVMLVAQFNM
jgi:hypothetical protein